MLDRSGNRNWIHPNAGNSLIRRCTIISDFRSQSFDVANAVGVIPITFSSKLPRKLFPLPASSLGRILAASSSNASDPLAFRERRSEQREPSLFFPTRAPSRVKIIDGATRRRSPCFSFLRFPLWSKGRSPSRGKQKGNRTDIGPNNARWNFLSEIAVPNIIDNWYDTRLVALLEFYREPYSREKLPFFSNSRRSIGWGYSGCPNIANIARTTIHSSQKRNTVNSKTLTRNYGL